MIKKSKKNKKLMGDVVSKDVSQNWVYSAIVKDHFFHPRNFLDMEPKKGEFDAEGIVGSPACGDVMRMWIKVDKKTNKIKDLKWKTFGCATAIASTSMFSLMVTENGGMEINKALKITPQDVVKRLGGLPAIKIHCSVLADQAFKAAVKNYLNSQRK